MSVIKILRIYKNKPDGTKGDLIEEFKIKEEKLINSGFTPKVGLAVGMADFEKQALEICFKTEWSEEKE